MTAPITFSDDTICEAIDAFHEGIHNGVSPWTAVANVFATALTRRSVQGEAQRDAFEGLRAAYRAYFEGSPHDGTEKSPEGYLCSAIERVLSLGAPRDVEAAASTAADAYMKGWRDALRLAVSVEVDRQYAETVMPNRKNVPGADQ